MELSRRRVVKSVPLLAAGVAADARAQARPAQQVTLDVTPELAAAIHGDTLQAIGQALGDTPLISNPGFTRVVDLLQQRGIITPAEAAILKALAEIIYSAQNVDALQQALARLLTQAQREAGQLVQAATRIARSSYDFARRQTPNIPLGRLTFIIASDVTAVITMAPACAKLGNPILMLVGAACAAVAGSGTAIYGSKDSVLPVNPQRGR